MLPHGVKETQCPECGAKVFRNSLSGHRVKKHTRNDPAWGSTGPMGRLETISAFDIYTLHRCGEKAPIVLGDGTGASDGEKAALLELRRLAIECGLEGLGELELEETHEALSSLIRSLREEIQEIRSGTETEDFQAQIDGLTKALQRETRARKALEVLVPAGDLLADEVRESAALDQAANERAKPEVQPLPPAEPELPPGATAAERQRARLTHEPGVPLGRKVRPPAPEPTPAAPPKPAKKKAAKA